MGGGRDRNQSNRVSIEISYCSLASRCCARTARYSEPMIDTVHAKSCICDSQVNVTVGGGGV